MALFNPTRDQVRQFFFDSWRKFKQQQPLTNMEAIALEVIQLHPEYHAVLEAPEHYLDQAYYPEMAETNPFLHMSLHVSILEQIAINQPPGIAQAYLTLQKTRDIMEAQHALMDCLAETIWQAQRSNQPPDAEAYLQCLQQKASVR